jgi:hypothetical protein
VLRWPTIGSLSSQVREGGQHTSTLPDYTPRSIYQAAYAGKHTGAAAQHGQGLLVGGEVGPQLQQKGNLLQKGNFSAPSLKRAGFGGCSVACMPAVAGTAPLILMFILLIPVSGGR